MIPRPGPGAGPGASRADVDPTRRPVGDRTAGATVEAFAPGRVNLIGEHTDYTGGLALPMAVSLGTTVRGQRGGSGISLDSPDAPGPATVPLPPADPAACDPPWARYVAGVATAMGATGGFTGTVSSTLPIGAGLSSSAALELATALALGFEGTAGELAVTTQRAEQLASGVPCGLMDQLASACGVGGHALLMDFTAGSVTPVPLPERASVVVVHSGTARALSSSAYASRRAACEAAAAELGPLRSLSVGEVAAAALDEDLRRHARHVVSENARVRDTVAALRADDLRAAGALLRESHESLRDDFRVSTPALDELVARLCAQPGVHGARLTGAGFGGCAVALAEPGALAGEGWHLRAAPGAWVRLDGPR